MRRCVTNIAVLRKISHSYSYGWMGAAPDGTLTKGARIVNLEKVLLHLKLDGFCVVEGVVPPEDVQTIRREVEAVMAAQGSADTYAGVSSAFDVLDSIPTFLPYLANEKVMAVAREWFGDHVRISYTGSMITEPGNERGRWHADWPYNQEKAAHVPAPYPDYPFQLSSIWMISEFTDENGGTWIVPGSHRTSDNPTGDIGVPLFEPYPTERHATGPAGSVFLFDSRLWHATASNESNGRRISMIVRYIPWWLDIRVLMPGTTARRTMVDEPGLLENEIPPVKPDVYERLPESVKPLYRHWVRSS